MTVSFLAASFAAAAIHPLAAPEEVTKINVLRAMEDLIRQSVKTQPS